MIRLRSALAAAAALLAFAHPAAAQDRKAEDILRQATARARARMQGVQNYTLNTKTMGISVVRYVSRGQDSLFHVQTRDAGPLGASGAQMTGVADDLLLLLEGSLAESEGTSEELEGVTYEGVVNSAGAPAHRISVSLDQDSADGSGEGMPRRLVVDFDTVTLVIRRLEAELAPGESMPRSVVVELGDWRPVGGMLLPFRRHMVIRGIRSQLGADTARVAQELEKARGMLADFPESQRESMRQVLALTESMLKRDEVVVDETVVSVAVNQGPAAGPSLPGRSKNH
ncbi:MAG: hypothetical protein ACJ8GN_20625 [Longimicrobiaceae bacterium]